MLLLLLRRLPAVRVHGAATRTAATHAALAYARAMATHRAVVVHQFGGPEQLRLETVATPAPKPDELLVRIRAVGTNPVDTYIRGGHHAIKPALPYTPGRDGAGVVEAVGADAAQRFHVGQRVYTTAAVTGTYAEKAIVKIDEAQPLPDALTFEQGAWYAQP